MEAIANMKEWEIYREKYAQKPILLGLERVGKVWREIGGQKPSIVVAVGGTNGKGSVCAMLESILRCAGYQVGMYTSPHLLSFHERIRINGMGVSDKRLNEAFEGVVAAKGAEYLTQFELDTLVAIQMMNDASVEVAILEVGLGGRLDAVNIFDSDVAVVTSVDMDHMDYLGDTLEKIAYEKAGIFRQGRVALFGDRDMPEVIELEAKRIGAELWRLGCEFGFDKPTLSPSPLPQAGEGAREGGRGQWNYRGPRGERNALPIPALRGAYQLNNASTVLAALDALKDKLPVSMDAVRRGLVEVTLAGRFQVLPGRPQIILDVAHNPHAARALAQNLAALPPARTFAVCAMLRDKDIAGVARELKGRVDVWLVAGLHGPRAASAAEMAAALAAEGVAAQQFPSVESALRHACNVAAENDRIAAFGSFYTVAEVMQVRGLRPA